MFVSGGCKESCGHQESGRRNALGYYGVEPGVVCPAVDTDGWWQNGKGDDLVGQIGVEEICITCRSSQECRALGIMGGDIVTGNVVAGTICLLCIAHWHHQEALSQRFRKGRVTKRRSWGISNMANGVVEGTALRWVASEMGSRLSASATTLRELGR